MSQFKLLCVDNDPKTVKGQARGWLTGILYLAPNTLSGRNVCSCASPGCIASCLNTAGHGRFDRTQESRVRKTQWFFDEQPQFMERLWNDIEALKRMAERMGMRPCVRLNGTSDLFWEGYRHEQRTTMQMFPDVQFYDYTKVPIRMLRYLGRSNPLFPRNYHLTFSRSETNQQAVQHVLREGGNVSVVFRGRPPRKWMGVSVINGDLSDLRFLDPKGMIVGLRAKGEAKKSEPGFVIDTTAGNKTEAICRN